MATTFPTSLQDLDATRGTASDSLSAVNHVTHHQTEDDTIEALQAKVGVDGSAVTTSHDYKLSGVTGSDKAVSKTGTETLTNKTLSSPLINVGSDATGDIYYRSAGGVFTRLAIGSSGQILQVSSGGIPEWIANPSAADASTTTKGVVEEATLAETLARTATGGTSARLFVNPVNLTTVMTYDYAADSVGSDAYAITVTPVPTAYVTGQTFTFKAGTANTGAATLNVNSLGAKTIKKNYNTDLETGDILANQIVKVVYDGTNMQLVSSTASALPLTYTANTDGGVTTWDTVTAIPDADLGWTVTATSPEYYANGVKLDANTNSGAQITFIGKAGSASGPVAFSDSGWAFRAKCSFININNTTANLRNWFGFTTDTTSQNSSDITNTTVHRVGLSWYNGALYFVTCNGSAVTATNIATRAGTVWDMVVVEFDGTTAKAILNGTTYTTTSTLPTTGTIRLLMGGYNSGGGTSGISVHGLNVSTKFNA